MDQTPLTFSKTLADFNQYALLVSALLRLHLRSRKALGLHNKPSKVTKVLAVIVDTGLAFLLLQLEGLNTIFRFLHFEYYSIDSSFQNVISSAYWLLTGMYPTIVIYLINQQCSLDEVFAISDPNGKGTPEVPLNRTNPTGPLAFAHSDMSTENTSSKEPAEPMHIHKGDDIGPIKSTAREKVQDMV
ncbi:hypothetical protein C0992_004888 [Termitomyces sp. T32_za158]|nr:hypothetical protein C0992_004888 [Termitomyces sp. T32_za158]